MKKNDQITSITSRADNDFLEKIRSVHISRRKFIYMAGAVGASAIIPSMSSYASSHIKRGGTLKVATISDPQILDPNGLYTSVELRICEQLFNGLVSIDENLNIVPDLAEEWAVTKDATVYEFKLRQGVMFHHGREFDAEDVVFTINRFKDSWVSDIGGDLEKVEALDKYTVRATFKVPAAHFLGSMAPRWTGMVPKDVVEKVGNDEFKKNPVGTGAFKFVEHVPLQKVITERNENYFREGLPYVDRIEWITIQDETSRAQQLLSGTVHVDLWAPTKMIDSFEESSSVEVIGGPTSMYEYIDLNCAKAPFDNQNVRKAVALATNRQEIIDLALFGRGNALTGGPIGPEGHPFYSDLQTYANTPNIEKARELLATAGISGGVSISGLVDSGTRYADVMEILQQQWKSIGINIEIEAVEAGAAKARRTKGDYNIIVRGWGTLVDPHDFTGENFYVGGGMNFGKCGDAKLDALLDKGVQTANLEQRKVVYAEQEKYIVEDVVPYVFLHRPHEYTVFQNFVKGLKHEAGRTKISLESTWIDT